MSVDVDARLDAALTDALQRASDLPTSTLVRVALRVAVLRQDPLGEFWLRLELEGVTSSRTEKGKETLARLTALVGSEVADQQSGSEIAALVARREIEQDGRTGSLTMGVAELEGHVDSLHELFDEQVTPGMTPIDTGLAAINRDKVRATVAPALRGERAVLSRVREAAYGYLIEAEAELIRGQLIPDVLSQGHAFVESELALRAPLAREALSAADERLANGDVEAMSHAATSCRRAIKALADVLYPPSAPVVDDVGVSRVLDDEHYRNRLVEYVRQRRGKSTHADVLASNLAVLGTRLKSLDDLASKGVHTRVSRAEAQACVSWTYLLAADLLRIANEAHEETHQD